MKTAEIKKDYEILETKLNKLYDWLTEHAGEPEWEKQYRLYKATQAARDRIEMWLDL